MINVIDVENGERNGDVLVGDVMICCDDVDGDAVVDEDVGDNH